MAWRRADGSLGVLKETGLPKLVSSNPPVYRDDENQVITPEYISDFPVPDPDGKGSTLFPGTKPGVGVTAVPTEDPVAFKSVHEKLDRIIEKLGA